MLVLIIVIAVVVLILLGAWVGFNGLVKRRNRTKEAWSQIDVELKRRHDLVPNLVSTVQGYAAHEQGTFEAVTEHDQMPCPPGRRGILSRSQPQKMRCLEPFVRCSLLRRTIHNCVP